MIGPIRLQILMARIGSAVIDCEYLVSNHDDQEIKTVAYATQRMVEQLVKKLEGKA